MKHLILLLTLLSGSCIYAQIPTSQLIDWQTKELSPSERRANKFFTSVDVTLLDELTHSTSYYATLKAQQETSDSTNIFSSFISSSYAAGETEGDFLTYEGKSSYDWRLQGFGIHDFGKYGILLGALQYNRGKHRDISWSAMRYPEYYLPYAKTDSTGGDSQYETYYILGGYSVNLHNWHLGVKTEFEGEQSYRLTDPRNLTNTTFLSFGASLGHIFPKGNTLTLHTEYMHNKQYEHDRYWRPGEQQRFFTLYGFGLYDTRESIVAFGTSRMFYIHSIEGRLTYQTPTQKRCRLTLAMQYGHKHLYTEESDIINLYESDTHELSPFIHFQWEINNHFALKLCSKNYLLEKTGTENFFEKYMTDQATSTYDFRLISQEHNYHQHRVDAHQALRLEWKDGPKHKIGLQGGTKIDGNRETNSKYEYETKNLSITPYARIDYSLRTSKHEFSIALQGGKQRSLKHLYNVDILNDAIEHLDFQTCFAPYAYNACEYKIGEADLYYLYHFPKFGLGCKITYMNLRGDRLDDVRYTKKIGFNSICPMISTEPDKHNEQWGKFSIFVTL